MRSTENLKKYISFEDLAKLDEKQKINVNRIFILSCYAREQLSEQYNEKSNPDRFKKIAKIYRRLLKADMKFDRPIWGIELTVDEILEAFSKEDVGSSRTAFRLPLSYKENASQEKDPMKLETGEELYGYLKDKSEKEIEDYFVSRGAVIEDGIMLNNGLSTLYRIEKDSVERQNDEEVSYFDGGEDGLER